MCPDISALQANLPNTIGRHAPDASPEVQRSSRRLRARSPIDGAGVPSPLPGVRLQSHTIPAIQGVLKSTGYAIIIQTESLPMAQVCALGDRRGAVRRIGPERSPVGFMPSLLA